GVPVGGIIDWADGGDFPGLWGRGGEGPHGGGAAQQDDKFAASHSGTSEWPTARHPSKNYAKSRAAPSLQSGERAPGRASEPPYRLAINCCRRLSALVLGADLNRSESVIAAGILTLAMGPPTRGIAGAPLCGEESPSPRLTAPRNRGVGLPA